MHRRQYNLLQRVLGSSFDNWFDNRVERTATVRSTGCQTGLYNRSDNRCIHDTAVCQTGLTTGCIVYTNILPGIVKPVV